MAVRKTERRLPPDLNAEDLGQVVSSADGHKSLVSYNSSPLAQNSIQAYVVFVTDSVIAGQVDHYDWTINNDAHNHSVTTTNGYLSHQLPNAASASIQVELKDAANTILETLTLNQEVGASNAELEALYSQTDQESVPQAGNPEASREVINDLRAYMDTLAPRAEDLHSSMNRLLFAICYVEVMRQNGDQRNGELEALAESFEAGDTAVLREKATTGLGVCRIRPHVLGMYRPKTDGGNDWYLTPDEFPEAEEGRLEKREEWLDQLVALSEEERIDLFNLLRFPKSNFMVTMQLINGIKEQYFVGEDLVDLIVDKDKIKLLISQVKEGPYIVP